MEAYTATPLVPPHLPRDHPLVTRDYSLFTLAIPSAIVSVSFVSRLP